MFGLCEEAIDVLSSRRADFGDIRIVRTRAQSLGVRNGETGSVDDSETLGFGVRVLLGGAWGFASSGLVTRAEVRRVSLLALEIARASAMLMDRKVRLAPEPAYRDFWQTPFIKDPFAVPVEEKFRTLFEADRLMRRDRRIKSALSSMRFVREHQWHATTEGSRIEQVLLSSGADCRATAVDGAQVQERGYPCSHGGQTLAMGYELIDLLDLPGHAEKAASEAVALLKAPDCPSGELDLITYGNQMALQIHESVGHASELDRVLGYEESYAGSSFATTEKLGSFRYGSPMVNLVADATLPGGLATAGYDDDAVKAQRWHIVKDGVLSGYMTNREFAPRVGLRRSQGSCRADGPANIPITRICNLSLMPGSAGSMEDLVRSTKRGIIMENNKSWSIDQRRLNFQFGCEIGWLVENGKIKKMVRNPTYQGITPAFWGSCDAICGPDEWRLWGVANCGKGQPPQTAAMCHGSSPARFKRVKVGVKAG
ncbi:MAG: TldD protein [Elusimicrobia bacterium]|nr:MAG: TldD protein [Elusimicrobiota bacterium]KAF0155798.1 MAG: TldD protein [Elusimicrobiota bacterium]